MRGDEYSCKYSWLHREHGKVRATANPWGSPMWTCSMTNSWYWGHTSSEQQVELPQVEQDPQGTISCISNKKNTKKTKIKTTEFLLKSYYFPDENFPCKRWARTVLEVARCRQDSNTLRHQYHLGPSPNAFGRSLNSLRAQREALTNDNGQMEYSLWSYN